MASVGKLGTSLSLAFLSRQQRSLQISYFSSRVTFSRHNIPTHFLTDILKQINSSGEVTINYTIHDFISL